MVLGQTYPMNDEERGSWVKLTADVIDKEIRKVLGKEQVASLKVKVTLQDQSPPFETPSPTDAPSVAPSITKSSSSTLDRSPSASSASRIWWSRRRLDEDSGEALVLTVIFDVEILLRSRIEEHDVGRYISGAFNSPNDKQSYVVEMRLTRQPAFGRTVSVHVQVPNAVPTLAPTPTSPPSSSSNIGLIVGLVVAIVSGLILGGFFVYRRRHRRRRRVQPPEGKSLQRTDSGTRTSDGMQLPNGIELNPDDDISTLGDPLPHGMIREQAGEGSTIGDGMSVPYDFRVEYGSKSVCPEGATDFNIIAEALSQDDNTLEAQYLEEERFEVEGPPGMLRMVLGSSPEGVPMVHTIKTSSPLAHQVQVGDKLLSVDGEDVSVLLASDVSRLISEKRDQPIRLFVFTRSRKSRLGIDVIEAMDEEFNAMEAYDPIDFMDDEFNDFET